MSLLEQMPRQCMQVRGAGGGCRCGVQLQVRQSRHQLVATAPTVPAAELADTPTVPLPLPACLPACLPPRLQEQRGERLLVACSLLLAGLQAACTYVVWTAAVAHAREQRKRAD